MYYLFVQPFVHIYGNDICQEISWNQMFLFFIFMRHADAVASSSIKFNYYFFLLLFFSTVAKINLSALEKKAQVMD